MSILPRRRDPQYLVGPGDELRLMVWGATEFAYDLTVDREGRILPRRRTGTSALYQRAVRTAVMRARFIGLLAFTSQD